MHQFTSCLHHFDWVMHHFQGVLHIFPFPVKDIPISVIIRGNKGVVKLKEIILMLTELLNNIHDFIQLYVKSYLNLNLNDKDLHFWIMGIIGISAFLFVLVVSKIVSKLPFGITILSFGYTFTFMVVLVFAIEIQQAITNRGNMEFQDAVVGLWGFIVFFLIFVVIVFFFLIMKRLIKRLARKNSQKADL